MAIFKTRKNSLFYILLAIVAVILLTNIVVYVRSSPYIYEGISEVKEAETALILGAAVYSDGDLTPVYKSRVDKAIELYNTKKVSKILASGDNSTVEHNEVNPVRNYLLSQGIPDVDIYLDHAGFDTYSTMYRARDIFKVSSVIVVTQSFHMPRAIFIARALGVEAHGLPANDSSVNISNYIREIFANEKALLNIIFGREPKYLGKEIPISAEKAVIPPSPTPEPGTDSDTRVAAGYISGKVEIGPNCPVETEDNPCTTPPEAYSSRQVIVYGSDGTTVRETGKIDSTGAFKIAIGPGNYFVQISPAGIGPGEKRPVKVVSFETTKVDFYIDTGIR